MLEVNQLIGFGAGGKGVPNIQFVGGKTATKAGATSGNSTIALNSGLTGGIASSVSNGDLVIAAFVAGAYEDVTLAITDGTNAYTLLGTELYSDDSTDTNLRVAYKFVDGDTSTTFGPTGNASYSGSMAVYVFRGVDRSNPLDVAVTTATGTDTEDANIPAITPVSAGAYIVCVAGSGHNTVASAYTNANMTDLLTVNGGASSVDALIGIGHKPDWTSGEFDPGIYSAGDNAGTSSWAAMSIALSPA